LLIVDFYALVRLEEPNAKKVVILKIVQIFLALRKKIAKSRL